MRLFPFLLSLTATVLLALLASPAAAHFTQETVLRTILLARDGDRLTAHVRAPLPLVLPEAAGDPVSSPFLYTEEMETGVRYRLSMRAVADREAAFRGLLEDALVWSQDGRDLTARVTAMRVHGSQPAEAVATVNDATAALEGRHDGPDPDFGQAYVDFAMDLETADPAGALRVRAGYPAIVVPDGVEIDNHIIDARGDAPVSYTRPGQLREPATIGGSVLHTAVEFVGQGVLHILEGLDHVFLVVCLALGIGAHTRLLWIVTAFTLGHSVTLLATFLGATPTWPWFIPAVETAIAATVLYAAVAALWRKMDSVAVIAGVGLLHGLGFSFVLGDILGRDAPNLIPALAAFNVGIEIGQLAIIAATLVVVGIMGRVYAGATPVLRNAALAGIAAMSAWWVIERSAGLLA